MEVVLKANNKTFIIYIVATEVTNIYLFCQTKSLLLKYYKNTYLNLYQIY